VTIISLMSMHYMRYIGCVGDVRLMIERMEMISLKGH